MAEYAAGLTAVFGAGAVFGTIVTDHWRSVQRSRLTWPRPEETVNPISERQYSQARATGVTEDVIFAYMRGRTDL